MNDNSQVRKGQARKKSRTGAYLLAAGCFAVFIIVSVITGFEPGIGMGNESWTFLKSMLLMFPPVFILIGLFEVWVDRSIIERHLGGQSGPLGYFWIIILASTIMTPMIMALPIAHSLYRKGARLNLVIAFISANTVCRIPMVAFEASFLGIRFTLVRLLVALPLIILFSEIISRLLGDESMPERL